MNILDSILNHQDGAAVQQVAQQFGLGNEQAISALSALVPQLASGVQQNLQQPGGLQSLLGALASGQHDQYLNDPTRLGDASTIADGNNILGHILGSKSVSQDVTANAAAQTGISQGLLKQMLPIAATLVMGSLARQTSQAGSGQVAANSGAGVMGTVASMLDANHDGSAVDDVVGMVGKFLGGTRS
jgi:hypothetical protein